MKPALLLDCYLDQGSCSDNFLPLLESGTSVVRPSRGEAIPESAGGYSAVLLSGSAASILDDSIEWLLPLLALVRDARRRRTPVFGVCFGHQAIARALFGRGAVRHSPSPEFGFRSVRVKEDDPLFEGVEPAFVTFMSHLDEVLPVVPELKILAASADCAVQAFRVAGEPLWGVQFHAEMGREETERVLREHARKEPELGIDPEVELRSAVDSSRLIHILFENFKRLVAANGSE